MNAKTRLTQRNVGLSLDLLKSSTPITTAKISNKLRELAFKLDVEKKLKAGSERLAVLYRNDPSMGDKKNRAGVNGELLESNEKIVLLKRALQKYQQLFVPGMEDDGKCLLAIAIDYAECKATRCLDSYFEYCGQPVEQTMTNRRSTTESALDCANPTILEQCMSESSQ